MIQLRASQTTVIRGFHRARRQLAAIERALLAPIGGAARGWQDFVAWALRLGTTMRNASANAIVAVIDQGSGAGSIKVHTATPPGSVGGSYGTLLGTLPLSDPAFGSASTGVCTLDVSPAVQDTSADNSGTAQSFTFNDSDANVLCDGTAASGSGDMNFSTTNVIVSGGTIAVSAGTITVPIS